MKIFALLVLLCFAPSLAVADNAAQTRVKKAAEYRDRDAHDAKEDVEQPSNPSAEQGEKRPDAPKERQPQKDGAQLENMLDGLMKFGESR